MLVCQLLLSSTNERKRSKRSKSDRKSATSGGGSRNSFHPTIMGVLAFFALLKIMVTYISFNEGSYRFLPSLCAQSFVSNEINAAPKQWMLAFYQWTWGKKKGIRTRQRARRGNESRGERASECNREVFAFFFMETKSSSRFHVVISISNYPISKRLHSFGEPGFPGKKRART